MNIRYITQKLVNAFVDIMSRMLLKLETRDRLKDDI